MFGVTGSRLYHIHDIRIEFVFKYKSRGFSASGAGRAEEAAYGCLARELAAVILGYMLLGIIGAFPYILPYLEGFQALLLDARNLGYSISMMGIAAGVLLPVCLLCCIFAAGYRFIRRADIMEILKTQRKSEIVKDIRPWTGKLGLACVIIGLALCDGRAADMGQGVSSSSIPALEWSLSDQRRELYLFLLSAVGRTKRDAIRKKYYKNIISTNLMRFTARQTTKRYVRDRDADLRTADLCFWGMQYYDSAFRNGENVRSIIPCIIRRQNSRLRKKRSMIWQTGMG